MSGIGVAAVDEGDAEIVGLRCEVADALLSMAMAVVDRLNLTLTSVKAPTVWNTVTNRRLASRRFPANTDKINQVRACLAPAAQALSLAEPIQPI